MRLTNLMLCLLLVASYSAVVVNSYKILGVLHTGARSHFIVGSALMRALAQKGHEVYVISPFPQKQPIKNYYDVPLYEIMKVMNEKIDNLLDQHEKSVVSNVLDYFDMGIQFTDSTLKEPAVQELIASNHTFDVVICEVFLSEALFGLSEHFKAPLIGLGTFGAISWNTDMTGSPSPPSYVPNALLRFTDHMSLTERVGNLAFLTFERLFMDYSYLPRQAAVYNKYFPNAERDMYTVRKNAAAVLLNSHVSLSFSRPYVPNQIEVGGMHINRQRKPLPADIEKFINESRHGVIYFSMGSNLKSKNLPAAKRQALLNAFKGLKQRVLWKFEDPKLEGKPDNVFISDWFPQDDILAHENVKLFITHGGLLSSTESIYHGTPIIGIPIFGDQFLNMHINRERHTLPKEIENFIKEAQYGVIYFSMGSNLKSKDLPAEKKTEILKAFQSLKQRVLWKFEDLRLEGKPDNVFISEWFPQDDILAQENVKLFITHCGLLSTTESIYHAKPIIGIPIFGDQFLNMAKAEANGYGIRLDYQTLNAKDLVAAIEHILHDKSYTERVREISLRYRDQPILPMDLAIHWIEYVAKHKGAKHLHCVGLDLNFFQYHNIDVIILFYGGILFIFMVLLYLIKKIIQVVLRKLAFYTFFRKKSH